MLAAKLYEAIWLAYNLSIGKRIDIVTEENEWAEEWESLAQKIDKAWKSEKSALEILSEMRR